jgi:hypothetical protein
MKSQHGGSYLLNEASSSARKRARRRRRRDTYHEREESKQRERRGLIGRVKENCNWRRKYERRGSESLIRRRIAGTHGTIGTRGVALRVAIALVLLQIAALTMMHGAVDSIAANGRNGSGKRLGERRHACCQQREKRRDRQKLSSIFSQFHEFSISRILSLHV